MVKLRRLALCVLRIPDMSLLLQPTVEVIALQLLVYHIAVLCGRDVDRPATSFQVGHGGRGINALPALDRFKNI